jgi:GTP-binding protein
VKARKAEFLISASDPKGFPAEGPPEIAFAGRSNVGKSSMLNTLVGVTGLAKTSSTPGRTQLVNFFSVTSPMGVEMRFVDLPGYGYAKVSKEARAGFKDLVDAYIGERPKLALVVLILDLRRGLEDEEKDFLLWLDELGRKSLVVLTKADKVSKAQRFPAAAAVKRSFRLHQDPIIFSATELDGVDDLWKIIAKSV